MQQSPDIYKWVSQNTSFEIELIYSDPHHPDNIFVTPENKVPYVHDADFIVSEPIGRILDQLDKFIPKGMKMRLYDCLRPTEAQIFMKTFKDQLNIDHNMLSDPGQGGHPRGMAIDCALMPQTAPYAVCPTDYGTGFDDLDFIYLDNGTKIAKAHRNNLLGISFFAKQNRLQLELVMQKAALAAKIPLMPLPQEWWDFRLPKNQGDYKYILASFRRILLGAYDDPPDIESYGAFHDYWTQHFDFTQIPIEKRHIFDVLPLPPSEEDFVFYDNYAPISETILSKKNLKLILY